MIRVLALSLLLASCTVYETKAAEFQGLYSGLIMGFKFEEDADGISRRDSNTDVHFIKDMSTNSMIYGKWKFTDTFEIDAAQVVFTCDPTAALADHYVQSTSSIDMSAATPQGVIAQ